LEGLFIDYRDREIAMIRIADVSASHPYALWMPQPAMLGALHALGRTLPSYDLWFHASARELLHESGRVSGVVVKRGDDHVPVRARVVVAADGRYSRLRKGAGLDLEIDDYDFDVLWFDRPRPGGNDATFRAWLTPGRNFLVLPKYPDLHQFGMLTEPSGLAHYRARGLESLRADLLAGPTILHDFARSLEDFTPFHPLEARMALARTWAQDGFLMVGDAAHTCSPAGAVGVAVAVETAIVAADVVIRALRRGDLSQAALSEVEHTRKPEVRKILASQKRLGRVIAGRTRWIRPLLAFFAPVFVKTGIFQRIMGRVVSREGRLPVPDDLGFPR
jgi:2-polyprenyl-6-methoxyphenol hydroxylase-like FAD-dependent oxidoreductase